MDRLALLNTLLDREKKRRDAALAEWRETERLAEAAREQADSLLSYRVEYRQRWAAQFSQRAPIEIVRCYQAFVERLDLAIGAQQGAAQQAAERVNAARARLQQREVKVATVQRLMERRLQAAALGQQRRDQKASDEAAQRLGWAARQQLAAA